MRMPVCCLGAGAGEEGAGGVVSGEEVGEGKHWGCFRKAAAGSRGLDRADG